MNPCEIISKISSIAQNWQIQQSGVKEESLTDWILFSLSMDLPFVQYMAFTRHEEATKTGADWEWWIIGRDRRAICFRVQAKRINKIDNYASILYSNQHGFQLEKLIRDATNANAIPLYAFYSDKPPAPLNCHRYNSATEGIYFAKALEIEKEVFAQARRKISQNELLSLSMSLSCMLCCGADWSDPSYIDKLASAFLRGTGDSFEGTEAKQIGIHNQIPHYVDNILNRKRNANWEHEFGGHLNEFSAIFIFDLRDLTDSKSVSPDQRMATSSSEILWRDLFERISKIGNTDPSVHLWIGVMSNDIALVKESLNNGAEVDITREEIVNRFKEIILSDSIAANYYNILFKNN